MAHVGADRGPTELGDDAVQLLHAFCVGRDLRLDVGDIHIGAARRISRTGQQSPKLSLTEQSTVDEKKIVDDDTLFLQRAGLRWGGTGRDAADIRVMAAAADEEQNLAAGGVKHRRNDRDIRQMRAAVERIVQRHDVAGFQRRVAIVQHRAHTLPHRAEVHGHMRSIGDQSAFRIENGAGEIEAFLDVHAHRRVLQHGAGLFRDVHEQIVEQLQQHRIGPVAAGGYAGGQRFGTAQQHMIQRRHLGGPAGFDQGCGIGFPDQRRPGDAVARAQCGALVNRRDVLGVAGENGDMVHGGQGVGAAYGQRRFPHRFARRYSFHRDRLYDQAPFGGREAEAGAVRFRKVRDDRVQFGQRHDQCCFGADVAKMQMSGRHDPHGVGTLLFQRRDGFLA